MQPEDRQSWFWTLSELGESLPPREVFVPDEVLKKYRKGQLTEDERHEVELLLIANPQNRRRLIELAHLAPKTPSANLRRRILHGEERSPRARYLHRGWLGLAAAAVLGIAFGWFLLNPANNPPAYDVRIQGLTYLRGVAGQEEGMAAAQAGTTVVIHAIVSERARAGVEVALYRVVDKHLSRIPIQEGGLRQEAVLGAVEFKGPASALAGPEPGLYDVFVVVAWEGELPMRVAFEQGEDPLEVLTARGHRRAYRLTLRLLAESSAVPPLTSDPPPDEETRHVALWIDSARNFNLPHPGRFRQDSLLGTLRRAV